MLFPRDSPAAIATRRKIYVFGSTGRSGGHFAEVLDTDRNHWDKLPAPSDLVDLSVSHPVLLDSPRHRVLVHFRPNNSLHAFLLDGGSWECLDPEFGYRSEVSPVIVDDVAYFLFAPDRYWSGDCKEDFQAYHVVDKKWLPVKRSSEAPSTVRPFPNMFHLGKGLICVAWFCVLYDTFEYIKFRVHFNSNSGEIRAHSETASITQVPFQRHTSQISVL